MDYETFKEELTSELVGLGYSSESISFTETQKNNGVTNRTLTVRNDLPIAPNINLEHFIEEHSNGRKVTDIASAIDGLIKSQPDFSNVDFNLTWDRIKDNVVFVLVNGETNKDLLERAPHISFLDFAMIYKIDTDFLGIPGYITVDDKLMETLKVSPRDLLFVALDNTPELMPAYVESLKNVMAGIINIPVDDDIDMGMPDVLVASNKGKNYGASAILYSDFANMLGEKGIEDCYVIPSSVHECLMVHDCEGASKEDLECMVREVNASDCVSDEEFLSNKVYRYSEIKKEFHDAVENELIDLKGMCFVE
ncbi:MAG: hypothetical protein J5959_06130, partial [Butyrivibrio sp.]|nr:hypothetical protein [Butyrivibrio sp.]